jgi:hypothetical protein
MSDKKISQLTSASLPLAGTEVLPIVQAGETVKVASDDLTVKNVRSNATTGLMQIVGPATGTTRVVTIPDANATMARTDAAQSFTGDQTLATGNLVIGTSGKGIDFSATPGTGTSELLADYEEGTWTPTYVLTTPGNSAFTYNVQNGQYTKVGNLVFVKCVLRTATFSNSTGSGDVRIAGLPFASKTGANYSGGNVQYSISFAVNNPTSSTTFESTFMDLSYKATSSGASAELKFTDLNTGASTNYLVASMCYTTN